MKQFMLSVLLLSLAIASLAVGDNQEVDSIQYQVFNIRAPNLNPIETDAKLKLLQISFDSGYSGKSLHLKNRVEKLVEACTISVNRCDDEYFDEINELGSKSSMYHSNVVLYLWHCKQEQYKLCIKQQVPKIKDAVSHLSRTILGEMKALRQMVDVSRLSDLASLAKRAYIPDTDIDDAVANYVRFKLGPMAAEAVNKGKEDGIELYRGQVERIMRSTCEPVKKEFDSALTNSYLPSVEQEGELLQLLDGYSSKWIENYRICSKILSQLDILIDESFARLSSSNSDDF